MDFSILCKYVTDILKMFMKKLGVKTIFSDKLQGFERSHFLISAHLH